MRISERAQLYYQSVIVYQMMDIRLCFSVCSHISDPRSSGRLSDFGCVRAATTPFVTLCVCFTIHTLRMREWPARIYFYVSVIGRKVISFWTTQRTDRFFSITAHRANCFRKTEVKLAALI